MNTMIANDILYFSFLSSGWLSAVCATLTPGIHEYIASTDLNPYWEGAYQYIDEGALDFYLMGTVKFIGTIVNNYINDNTGPPQFQEIVNSIPRVVSLMRYSNLRFLEQFRAARRGGATALAVIDAKYVTNVGARYYLEKHTERPESDQGNGFLLMPYMLDVAVLFSMNQSMIWLTRNEEDEGFKKLRVRERLGHYQKMVNRVHKDLARLTIFATLERYPAHVARRKMVIDDLRDSGIRGYLAEEIQTVTADLANDLLSVIMLYGDAEHSPKLLSVLIDRDREVRHLLNVSLEDLQHTPETYWLVLLLILDRVVEQIEKESEAPPQWIQDLREMVQGVIKLRSEP
jgi:hypothetical protein